MKKDTRQFRRDGFYNFSATGDLPVLSEGTGSIKLPVIDTVEQEPIPLPPIKLIKSDPILPNGGPSFEPAPFYDAEFEIDYYSLDCATLKKYIAKLNNLAGTGMLMTDVYDPAGQAKRTFYAQKLITAESAFSAKCGANDTGMINDPNPLPPVKSPESTTVVIPAGSAIPVVNVGGGSGGGSGSGSTTPAATTKKKNNWLIWLVAGSTVGLALYQTRK